MSVHPTRDMSTFNKTFFFLVDSEVQSEYSEDEIRRLLTESDRKLTLISLRKIQIGIFTFLEHELPLRNIAASSNYSMYFRLLKIAVSDIRNH